VRAFLQNDLHPLGDLNVQRASSLQPSERDHVSRSGGAIVENVQLAPPYRVQHSTARGDMT
jgi:hypothetical protein